MAETACARITPTSRRVRSPKVDRPQEMIETVLASGQSLTPDLGGTATTNAVGEAIRSALE
jgi:hypothetical protein